MPGLWALRQRRKPSNSGFPTALRPQSRWEGCCWQEGSLGSGGRQLSRVRFLPRYLKPGFQPAGRGGHRRRDQDEKLQSRLGPCAYGNWWPWRLSSWLLSRASPGGAALAAEALGWGPGPIPLPAEEGHPALRGCPWPGSQHKGPHGHSPATPTPQLIVTSMGGGHTHPPTPSHFIYTALGRQQVLLPLRESQAGKREDNCNKTDYLKKKD